MDEATIKRYWKSFCQKYYVKQFQLKLIIFFLLIQVDICSYLTDRRRNTFKNCLTQIASKPGFQFLCSSRPYRQSFLKKNSQEYKIGQKMWNFLFLLKENRSLFTSHRNKYTFQRSSQEWTFKLKFLTFTSVFKKDSCDQVKCNKSCTWFTLAFFLKNETNFPISVVRRSPEE